MREAYAFLVADSEAILVAAVVGVGGRREEVISNPSSLSLSLSSSLSLSLAALREGLSDLLKEEQEEAVAFLLRTAFVGREDGKLSWPSEARESMVLAMVATLSISIQMEIATSRANG